jgi:hypothetical protein
LPLPNEFGVPSHGRELYASVSHGGTYSIVVAGRVVLFKMDQTCPGPLVSCDCFAV